MSRAKLTYEEKEKLLKTHNYRDGECCYHCENRALHAPNRLACIIFEAYVLAGSVCNKFEPAKS